MADATTARQALAEAVLEHLLADGRLDASLRTLAASIGVGHSLLLYHFGSRDGLLQAVHEACEQRERDHLTALRLETGDPLQTMQAFWERVADEQMWPIYRLGFSLRAARGASDGQHADREQWIATLQPLARSLGFRGRVASDEALLWLAGCRGLLWELVTGADRAAVHRAARRFFAHYATPST